MSRKKLLVENIFVYGMGAVGGKLIPLLMLPVITRLITDTSIFGNYDMVLILSSFGSAIALLGIHDAMFRFYFDKSDDKHKKSVCSTSLFIVSISAFLVMGLVLVFSKQVTLFVFKDISYIGITYVIAIIILLNSIQQIVTLPFRIRNMRKMVIIISWATPLLTYSISIPLIIFIDPLKGLVFAVFFTPLIISIISIIINRSYFALKYLDWKKITQLIKFGLPLVPTFVIYWVLNSIDRIMINRIIGPAELGIYAVGAKLGHASNLIRIAFTSGFQYFLFSTMNYRDRVEKNSKIFEYLLIIIAFSFFIVNPVIKPIFPILFGKIYAGGHIVTPYLFLSPLFMILFQLSSSQNQIDKKSYISPLTLLPGLMLSVTLNFLLIPKLGIEGAAIANLSGYMISMAISITVTKARKIMDYNYKILLIILFICADQVLIRLFSDSIYCSIAISLTCIIATIILYNKSFMGWFLSIKHRIHHIR